MQLFYFNTGVTPNNRTDLYGDQVWRNGTIQIPFECDNVPDGAIFKFACDIPDLELDIHPNRIVRKIHNSDLLSKYAYFDCPNKEKTTYTTNTTKKGNSMEEG